MNGLVGIVGGAGAEGVHFAEVIYSSGCDVAISDVNEEEAKKLCSKRGYHLMSSEELATKCNLTLFSLPIDVTPIEIERLAPLIPEAMADLTSVKTNAMKSMLNYSNSDVEVFSIHGMYRPTVSPWGQNILMISSRPSQGGEWFNYLNNVFEKQHANVSVIDSAEKHDKISALLQVLPHSITYAYLSLLEQYSNLFMDELDLYEIEKFSTLFSRMMLQTTGRVVSNPNAGGMYGLIQSENPHTELIYDWLIATLINQKECVLGGNDFTEPDLNSFASQHRALNNFVGRYGKIAAERQDRMMGRPFGIQLVYDTNSRDQVEATLDGFRKPSEPYKENLETTWVLTGELSRLFRSEEFVMAKQSFYKREHAKSEGIYAFYIRNKQHDGQKLRFSPVIPEKPERSKIRVPNQKRIQMYNNYQDQFLNLFNTWDRTPELHDLGTLIAYTTI